jgi:hypothetical protein
MPSDLINQYTTIGICTVISIIVFYLMIRQPYKVTKDEFKRKEIIQTANEALIESLTPYVAENGLPDIEVMDMLLISTARKFRLEYTELYSIRMIAEELVRLVLESPFVSSDNKELYSEELRQFLEDLNLAEANEALTSDLKAEIMSEDMLLAKEYQLRMEKALNILSTIYMACFLIMAALLLPTFHLFDRSYDYLFPLVASIASIGSCRLLHRAVLYFTRSKITKKKAKVKTEDQHNTTQRFNSKANDQLDRPEVFESTSTEVSIALKPQHNQPALSQRQADMAEEAFAMLNKKSKVKNDLY